MAPSSCGQVADDRTAYITARIDALLAEAGSDRSKLVSAQIWLKSMEDDKALNAVWPQPVR